MPLFFVADDEFGMNVSLDGKAGENQINMCLAMEATAGADWLVAEFIDIIEDEYPPLTLCAFIGPQRRKLGDDHDD